MLTGPCRAILFVLLAIATAGELLAQDWSKVKIQKVRLAENLYVLAGAGGNIVLSVGEDGPLLVDTGYEQLAEKVIAAVGTTTEKPIRLVVDTHWHFDHVGGNEALHQAGAVTIAHENVRARMSTGQFITGIDRDVAASPAAALPMITYAQALTLNWNGDEVRLLHVESAHTDGDSFVFFRRANVLHVGDTWFRGMYPFFDVNAGGSLDGLVKAADRALALADEKTQIVPGHGAVSDAATLRQYRDMLATVRDRVRALVGQGKSREEVIAAQPTKEFDEKWGQQWLAPNTWVGLVYDGMSEK